MARRARGAAPLIGALACGCAGALGDPPAPEQSAFVERELAIVNQSSCEAWDAGFAPEALVLFADAAMGAAYGRLDSASVAAAAAAAATGGSEFVVVDLTQPAIAGPLAREIRLGGDAEVGAGVVRVPSAWLARSARLVGRRTDGSLLSVAIEVPAVIDAAAGDALVLAFDGCRPGLAPEPRVQTRGGAAGVAREEVFDGVPLAATLISGSVAQPAALAGRAAPGALVTVQQPFKGGSRIVAAARADAQGAFRVRMLPRVDAPYTVWAGAPNFMPVAVRGVRLSPAAGALGAVPSAAIGELPVVAMDWEERLIAPLARPRLIQRLPVLDSAPLIDVQRLAAIGDDTLIVPGVRILVADAPNGPFVERSMRDAASAPGEPTTFVDAAPERVLDLSNWALGAPIVSPVTKPIAERP